MTEESHRSAQKRGRWGETIAAALLRAKGFRILAQNLRLPMGEIDVIARRGSLVLIVEVKTRRDEAQAAESITRQQRRRIAQATHAYLATRPELAACRVRFDAVLLSPWMLPRHMADAWRIEW